MQRLRYDRLGNVRTGHHLASTRLGGGVATFPHTHDFPELFLVVGGAGAHHWNGEARPLARGTLAWVAAADRHHYTTAAGDGLEFVNLALAPAWWAKFGKLTPAARLARGAARRLGEGETAELERDLRAWLATDGSDELRLTEMTARLLRTLRAREAVAEPGLPEWLAAWRDELRRGERLGEPLAYWQRRSGRSPEHLARSCRKFLGVPPTELIARARVAWVQARLRAGDAKVAALALESGFQNLGYFYRTFRRVAGVTPREWAAGARADEAVPR